MTTSSVLSSSSKTEWSKPYRLTAKSRELGDSDDLAVQLVPVGDSVATPESEEEALSITTSCPSQPLIGSCTLSKFLWPSYGRCRSASVSGPPVKDSFMNHSLWLSRSFHTDRYISIEFSTDSLRTDGPSNKTESGLNCKDQFLGLFKIEKIIL